MLWLEKRLVLLVTFLALGLGQYWASVMVRSVALPAPWRAALIMGFVVFSYTLAAEAVTPYLQRAIRGVHGSLKPHHGALAGVGIALGLLALLYWGYLQTYCR